MRHTQFTIKMFNWKKALEKYIERWFFYLTGLELGTYIEVVKDRIEKERRNKKNGKRTV